MSASATLERPYLKSPGFWALAFRAYAYPATITPILLAGAYAFYELHAAASWHFNWPVFALTLIAGLAYHTGCNLVNDYYDFKHGIDRPDTYGGSRMLPDGRLTPGEVLRAATINFALGTLLGLYFIWYLYQAFGQSAALQMLLLGGIGLLAAIYYTATPFSAKYAALGEPLVFLMFGPGYVLGAYLLQTGHLSWNAVWLSIPQAFIVTAILQANDTRDLAFDRESKIRTASIIFGATGARVFLSTLYFAPYIAVVLLAALHITPWLSLLALLTFPLALQLHKLFWTVRDEKSEKLLGSVENTAKLHMAFGLLMSLGVLVGTWVG